MEKLIEINSLTAGYNGNIVLSGIDLEIYEKDFLGIIGPNGGGKTTLLRIILGLLKPIKGTINYSNELQHAHRKKIGYLPQFKNIDDMFPINVFEVVLSGLMSTSGPLKKFSKYDSEKADAMLNELGVYHLKKRQIGDLSGGEMQRVFLGRALISSPRLLLLDEPSTFVDSSFSHDLDEILNELNKNIAILLVSHDIGSILNYVKNIACVNGTLHYHKSDEFTQELIDKYNCSLRLLGHGDIAHTVLKRHEQND